MNTIDYAPQLEKILRGSRVQISELRPSEWAEQNIIMPPPFPGPLRYELTEYTREIIDRFAPDDPAHTIAVMGAAQFGKSATIIIPVIGYIIANNPGNIIMTVGHEDLVKEAVDKVDAMLDSTGLRKLIRPAAQRAKATKSGDTDLIKQFPKGYWKLSTASNPKIWRQADYKFGLIDDYEAVKGSSKIAGNIRELVEKRFTAYATTKKILYVSSPELMAGSNIYEVYTQGDQRKFMVPCPKCNAYIELLWETKGLDGQAAGITWSTDEDNRLIPGSVGYTCQKCMHFFTDQYKSDFISKGHWEPTAKPFKPGTYSYHMSCLYSPHGMTDWEDYVYKFLECHPPGGVRHEQKYQTFLNLNLGWPYEPKGEAPNANQLQKNIRGYKMTTIPEKLSVKDGNGEIVMLTCAIDMNGTVFNETKGTIDDARLDWEITAWSESGSSYSVAHGSIGTFIPFEGQMKFKADRVRWSYDPSKPNCVWPELDKILDAEYSKDTGGHHRILLSGLDTGHFTNFAYDYIDKRGAGIVGLKGDKEDSFTKMGVDVKKFKPAAERGKLYILKVGLYKDQLSEYMNLKYDPHNDPIQPPNFCNFPEPENGKYLFDNYFAHFEAEEKIAEKKDDIGISFIWKKKSPRHQNHFWDCRIYNMALKDIMADRVCKKLKITNYLWSDFVRIVMGK